MTIFLFHFIALECDEGWSSYGESCYKIVLEQKYQIQAENSCKEEGAHLASFHSKGEIDFINKLSNYLNHLWIGLERRNNSFEWTDGSTFDYKNWDTSQPDNLDDPTHKCVEIWDYRSPYSLIGRWHDTICTRKYSYVCKKPRSGNNVVIQKVVSGSIMIKIYKRIINPQS